MAGPAPRPGGGQAQLVGADFSFLRGLLRDSALDDERVAELADVLEAGRLATCLPFLLEAGDSARGARDHEQLLTELLSLPHFAIDEVVERRAFDARRQLARAGHHRLPPVDLLVAATADRHRLGVLRYDLIAEKADLDLPGVRLAAPGTIRASSRPRSARTCSDVVDASGRCDGRGADGEPSGCQAPQRGGGPAD